MNQQDKPGKVATPTKTAQNESQPQVQGEGDYAADRRYRERTDKFLKDADVEEIARAAAPKSGEEAREMAEADKQGRSHAHLPPKR